MSAVDTTLYRLARPLGETDLGLMLLEMKAYLSRHRELL